MMNGLNDTIIQKDQQQEIAELDELFAEELPDQTDLVAPNSTWGSVGCFGSVGTFSGTAGTGSCVSTASSFGN
ncbi:MAG TPA: thiocillin family RiPP [Ktedonobacteraceae bacterium]|jgi:hypothetical protein|nr:thiocillin family RiPP [Ktedonobacteraceae bacterium]